MEMARTFIAEDMPVHTRDNLIPGTEGIRTQTGKPTAGRFHDDQTKGFAVGGKDQEIRGSIKDAHFRLIAEKPDRIAESIFGDFCLKLFSAGPVSGQEEFYFRMVVLQVAKFLHQQPGILLRVQPSGKDQDEVLLR